MPKFDMVEWAILVPLVCACVLLFVLLGVSFIYEPACVNAGYPKLGINSEGLYCYSSVDAIPVEKLHELYN